MEREESVPFTGHFTWSINVTAPHKNACTWSINATAPHKNACTWSFNATAPHENACTWSINATAPHKNACTWSINATREFDAKLAGPGSIASGSKSQRKGQFALIFLISFFSHFFIFSFYLDNKKWIPISTQCCSCYYRPSNFEVFLQDVK